MARAIETQATIVDLIEFLIRSQWVNNNKMLFKWGFPNKSWTYLKKTFLNLGLFIWTFCLYFKFRIVLFLLSELLVSVTKVISTCQVLYLLSTWAGDSRLWYKRECERQLDVLLLIKWTFRGLFLPVYQ